MYWLHLCDLILVEAILTTRVEAGRFLRTVHFSAISVISIPTIASTATEPADAIVAADRDQFGLRMPLG